MKQFYYLAGIYINIKININGFDSVKVSKLLYRKTKKNNNEFKPNLNLFVTLLSLLLKFVHISTNINNKKKKYYNLCKAKEMKKKTTVKWLELRAIHFYRKK